jgi:hypothetical protein
VPNIACFKESRLISIRNNVNLRSMITPRSVRSTNAFSKILLF